VCFDRALELTDDPAVRDHLLQRRASLPG
jgi:hypothetical protein